MKFSTATIALFAATVLASPASFDPSGAKNVGNGQGKQFIGGQCLNAADCGSGCCAGPNGICSGVGAQTQAGKTGCGFGGAGGAGGASSAAAASATSAAAGGAAAGGAADEAAQVGGGAAASPTGAAGASASPANGGPAFDPSGAKNVGNGQGKQFIGGQCNNAADCGSGCCAGPSGICSGVGAQTQAGKTGCGFGGAGKKLRRSRHH